MAKTINPSGFRKVTPGKCDVCGFDDDWECDGSGRIFCSCERCPECGEIDGCKIDCDDANFGAGT